MIWSNQQEIALKKVNDWLKSKSSKQVFYLAGFAGTGKTTLAKHFAENYDGTTIFGAYTGKAALVLQKKGCSNASTIHSMIYYVVDKKNGEVEWRLNRNGVAASADLIIIDEVSMVDETIGMDLLSFGKKVLVLGDPAQLPPVSGTGFFTQDEPDMILTEIHRQAKENPIIYLSMLARNKERIAIGKYGNSEVLNIKNGKFSDMIASDQLIVGRNNTRRFFNKKYKEYLNLPEGFVTSDKVICLKNNHKMGLLNGSLWNVENVVSQDENITEMKIQSLDGIGNGSSLKVKTHHAFYKGEEAKLDWKFRRRFDEFDFGYALTCHKSQGSQWDSVSLVDESKFFREQSAKWLYTAITRAAERLTIYI